MLVKNEHKKNFIKSADGVTAIEFAMVSPVLFLMVFGIVEFSLAMFVESTMEGAVSASGRYGKTGYVASGSTRADQIIATVAEKTAGLLDASKITVTTTIYPSFDSVSKPEPYTDTNHNGIYDTGEPYTDINGNSTWDADMGLAGLGNANDVVVYTISYPWTIQTPIIANFIGNTVTISSRSLVKNEPY